MKWLEFQPRHYQRPFGSENDRVLSEKIFQIFQHITKKSEKYISPILCLQNEMG